MLTIHFSERQRLAFRAGGPAAYRGSGLCTFLPSINRDGLSIICGVLPVAFFWGFILFLKAFPFLLLYHSFGNFDIFSCFLGQVSSSPSRCGDLFYIIIGFLWPNNYWCCEKGSL